MVGTTLGHYRIVGTLGKGGMGEVYLAEDAKLQRRVALKLLPATFAADPDRRKRFEREAQSVAALNHPNIVTIYSVEADGPVPFLTMEVVEGESLRTAIPKGGEPVDVLVTQALGISEAVAAAHQRGIIHRDLKPANVMVTPEGRVKVLDFGLAKLHEAEGNAATEASTRVLKDDLTGEGRIIGTVAYMSPEQAEGKPVDQRSDIFSLGVMLHEMATGERPFKGDTEISVISAILKDTPSAVTDIRPELPLGLGRIIKRCLAKDPLRRYQSAIDLHNDLEDLKQDLDSGIAVAASGSAVRAVAARSRKARGLAKYAAAIVGVALAAAAAWYGYDALRPRPRLFVPDKYTRITDTGKAYLAAVSADGRYVVHIKVEDLLPSLWLRQTNIDSDVRIVPPQDVRYDGLAFSPDGTFVYYNTYPRNSGQATLYRVPVLGGAPIRVLVDIDSAPAFSPDGAKFAFVRGDPARNLAQLMTANTDGSGAAALAAPIAPARFQNEDPQWSPDGRTIVVRASVPVSSGVTRTRLVGVDVASKQQTAFGSDWLYVDGVGWMPDSRSLLVTGVEASTADAQLWQVPWPAGERRRVTSGTNQYSGVSVSGDGKTIATIESEAHSNLFIYPLAGGAGRQVTSHVRGGLSGGANLAWLPDGRIIYASAEGGTSNQLWIMNADGSHPTQLTTAKGFAVMPWPAPDGQSVYYQGGDNQSSIWNIPLAGGEARRLTDGPSDFRAIASPDGKWIYYNKRQPDGRAIVMRIPASGGAGVALTRPESGFTAAMISRDGTRLLGTAWNAPKHRSNNVTISTDGGPLTFIEDVPPGATWLPDGKTWLYVDQRKGEAGIFTRPIAGGEEWKIVDLGAEASWALAPSPDGRELAVVRGVVTQDVVLIKAK